MNLLEVVAALWILAIGCGTEAELICMMAKAITVVQAVERASVVAENTAERVVAGEDGQPVRCPDATACQVEVSQSPDGTWILVAVDDTEQTLFIPGVSP